MSSAEVLTYEEEDAFVVKRTPNKRFYVDDSEYEEVSPRKRKNLVFDSESDSDSDSSETSASDSIKMTINEENKCDPGKIKTYTEAKKLFIKRTPKKLENYSVEEQYNEKSSKEGNIGLKVKIEPLVCRDNSYLVRDHFKGMSSFLPQEGIITGTDDESDEEDADEEGYSGDDDDDEGDFPDYYLDRIDNFTEEQNEVYEYVVKLIKDSQFRRNNPTTILLNGPAGTGKTELLKTLCDFVRKSYKGHCVYTAATGVAALKYKYGKTAHSAFGFPLDLTYEEQQRCIINEFKERDLAGADLIVIDEFQSVNITYIEMLDASLRNLMFSDKMFGGKVILFGADFRQVVPVVPLADDPSAFSPQQLLINTHIKTFRFNQACRTRRDSEYLSFIKRLGSDTLTNIAIPKDSDTVYVPLPNITFTTDLDALISEIYPDDILFDDPEECARRSILTPTRFRAQIINNKLATVASTITLTAEDVIANSNLFQKYFNSDLPEDKMLPEKDLQLWPGCLCMIMRSFCANKLFLMNGTKVIIEKVDMDFDKVWVKRLGDNDGNLICIDKYVFKAKYMGERFVRVQFPLMLCYATTIHKSQGQTFDKVGIDTQQNVFRHGQLYLALSRVKSRDDMILCVNETQVISEVAHAVNVVNRALIRNITA